jgi:pantoate--beta-alanine ligase
MLVTRTIADFTVWRRSLTATLGLVPTMGYLHEGHLSLVRASVRDNDHTAVTIFVNPAQFGPSEDLARYPRDEARDLALLDAEGVEAVFAPSVGEVYPNGFSTYVTVEGLTERMEGASRPTHFRGVTTVVAKLLNIARADRAYFGQKDAQQLAVVRRMARDLNIETEIVGMPIVREPDGLALSSRNVYLSPDERAAALVLSRALRHAEELHAAGDRDASAIRAAVEQIIRGEPLAALDYVAVVDAESLAAISRIERPTLVAVAARFGATRLIDNTVVAERP